MSNLQENLAQVLTYFGNFNRICAEIKTWHDAHPQARPRTDAPGKSTYYDLLEREDAPKSETLHYLCFWLLHARASRLYNPPNWASAGVLAHDMCALSAREFWAKHGDIVQGRDTVLGRQRSNLIPETKLHLVGIGALNIDTIARVAWQGPSSIHLSGHFDTGVEHAVDRSVYEHQLAAVRDQITARSLGGSSFNVIHALSYAAPRRRFGYVGCLGSDEKETFFSCFAGQHIDSKFVFVDDTAPTSRSLSLIQGEQRTLFTTRGDANDQLPRHIQENFDALVDYLARAKCIHISSIFSDEMPSILAALIQAVKARSAVRISFDPGWVWCNEMARDPALQLLMKQADVVFLNPDEFKLLSGAFDLTDEEGARSILPRCAEEASMLVYKQRDQTSLFHWGIDGELRHIRLKHRTLIASEIEDTTGAGDVLAAGILAHTIYDDAVSLDAAKC